MVRRLMIAGNQDGFTLLEVVFALTFLAISVMALAPMFVFASKQNATGRELGIAGAAAVQQLEVLRSEPYANLTAGGSLGTDVSGYLDKSDPEFILRWTIADNPNPPARTKIITVRAVATAPAIGLPKEVTIVTVRGD
ncbi:MAG: hypothetical protein GY716_03140 [bacterium]|nr:hypothetical protein [bacterium]